MSTKSVLSSPESPPTALARAVNKQFGQDWLEWEPMVIWEEIHDDLGVDLSKEHMDAIMATRTCMKSDAPWRAWHPFLVVVNAFNGNGINPEIASPVSISDLAYGVDLMRRLKPDVEFSDEVKSMAGIIMWDHGVCWAPQEGIGDMVNDYLIAKQKDPEQRALLTMMAKDYYADDGLDAMDDIDTVRMHTIKLKSLDLYIKMKRKLEEVT